MKVINQSGSFVVILAKSENLIDSLTDFCLQYNVNSAWIQGLGGALSAELGFYDLKPKQYLKTKLDKGPYEVSGLQGNIGLSTKEELVCHIHATLAGKDLVSFTGHIHKLIVGGTIELQVTPLPNQITRKQDNQTGLNLISD